LVDGSEVARAEAVKGATGQNRVEIGAAGSPVGFRDVYVGRDIKYESVGTAGKWDVPAGSFFFVGDNQDVIQQLPASYDSRLWSAELFHPPAGAPALAAKFTVPDEMGNEVANVAQVGG